MKESKMEFNSKQNIPLSFILFIDQRPDNAREWMMRFFLTQSDEVLRDEGSARFDLFFRYYNIDNMTPFMICDYDTTS